jgi:ABC-type branched-subunit amino acid transport system substrate-binding protein
MTKRIKYFFITLFLFFSASSNVFAQKIGLALPLMSQSESDADKKVGEYILKGVTDSYNEYKARNPKTKIEIKLGDTQRNPEVFYNMMMSYSKDNSIIAVLGPIFSSEMYVMKSVASTLKLPIISPTATADNLASESDYLFQLNPDYTIRGSSIAKYAIQEMNYKNILVLSENKYGRFFSTPFINEVIKNGGIIIDTFYYDNADLIESGFIKFKNTINSQKPDAIYISIASPADINVVSPLLLKYYPDLTVLGSSDWNNKETLLQNKNNLKTLYYECDFYLNDSLSNEYSGKNFSESELRNYLFGYNSMNFLLQSCENNLSRSKLQNYLNQQIDYPGIQNNIVLKNRVNHSLSIIRFFNGKLEKLTDYIY